MRKSRTSLIGHRRLGLRIVDKVFSRDFIYWMNLSLEVKHIYDHELCIKTENNAITKPIINDKSKQTTRKQKTIFISCIVVVIYNFFIKLKILHLHNANRIILL